MSHKIFVAIASYTDPELPRTLRDCIAQADKPDDLRFGICVQEDRLAPVPLDQFSQDARFRFIWRQVEESRGGPWARNLAQSLWRGEAYTLQVDAHMKFEPCWDTKLIEMLESVPSKKAVITMNAPLFHYDENESLHRRFDMGVPTTRVTDWRAENGWAPWFDFGPPNVQKPGRTRFINGNFAFSRGSWNVEVPQDPDHYYWGEEFSVTVRSYTWGYDFFLPTEVVAWHMYHQTIPPRRHWERGVAVVAERNATALERLRRLLFSPSGRDGLGPYGLGPHRTLRDYEVYAGFDFRNKRAHPDVFSGANPNPVTIHTDEDWRRCVAITTN